MDRSEVKINYDAYPLRRTSDVREVLLRTLLALARLFEAVTIYLSDASNGVLVKVLLLTKLSLMNKGINK